MSTLYHPIPIRVSYGAHIDPSKAVFGFHNPMIALQIASISFRAMKQPALWFPQPQAITAQRVNVALSAVNLREISLPTYNGFIFRQLAEGIPCLNDDSQAVPCTVWPHLRLLDCRAPYLDALWGNVNRDSGWIIGAAPALESVALYSPNEAPAFVPNGIKTLEFTVENKLSTSIIQSSIAAANVRILTLNGTHSTGMYDQPPAFQSMVEALLAGAPALVNLRILDVRGFGPKSCLAEAVVSLVSLPSLRTVRLLVVGAGDVRREAALLTRILDTANIGLRTLGLICTTSPVQRRGPLPTFVVEVLAKSRLPCLRTVLYAAQRAESGRLYPPVVSRPNAQRLKAVCMLRRVKLEVVELTSNHAWPGDELSPMHVDF